MALSRRRIEELAAKLVDGTISPAEQERLNRWLDERMRRDTRTLDSGFAADAETLRQRMLARILEQTGGGLAASRRGKQVGRWVWWSAAAAILVAVSMAVWFLQVTLEPEAPIELAADDILPGRNRATLTLADGRTVDLDEAQSGIIVSERISYLDGSAVFAEEVVEPVSLALTTPKGGTYQVTLPDGTSVWLNAGSTLTYPSRFAENERVVNLEGEAFFDVSHQLAMARKEEGASRVPFRVITKGQTVEVLGTAFNVSAYAGDTEIKTTLVEGSLKVTPLPQDNTLEDGRRRAGQVLVPGEQATILNGVMIVNKVEIEQYVAWKDGFFYFDGLSPTAAFVQLSRWYDLDILYQGSPPAVKFFGMIERDKPLGSILRILEKSGINFAVTQEAGRNQLRVLNE